MAFACLLDDQLGAGPAGGTGRSEQQGQVIVPDRTRVQVVALGRRHEGFQIPHRPRDRWGGDPWARLVSQGTKPVGTEYSQQVRWRLALPGERIATDEQAASPGIRQGVLEAAVDAGLRAPGLEDPRG